MTLTKPRSRAQEAQIDMTEGSIVKKLIKFTLPILVGNLFQQLYNMVDTFVIGQTGIDDAYAAVGSVAPIINILIGFFLGLSSGAGVVISQYFGAKNEEGVRRAAHTSIAITLVMGVFITIAGVLFTPLMVELMLGKDGSVYPYAKTYLIIYFAGVIGLMVYNIGAGILRAVGDSRHPFYFLVVSAVANIVLDVLFVFGFGMDVDGVALATVIAQCLSAVLTVITLLHNDTWVKLIPKQLRIDKKILRQIFSIGLPAAIQMALTAFSNVFVQSYIGGVDGIPQKVALGAWTSYSKIDQLLFLPAQSLGLAITTFVGQNLGNGDIKRAKRGTNIAYLMATVASIVAIIPIIFFADGIAPVFNSTPEIAENAAMLLRYITPFYLFCCINQVYAAALRGAGHTKIPMVIMLSAFVGFRQIYLFIVSNYVSNTLMWLGMAYPAGWALNSTTVYLYYRFCNLGKFRITKKEQ